MNCSYSFYDLFEIIDKDLDIKDAVDHNLQETQCLYDIMDIDDVFLDDLTLDTDLVDSSISNKS